MSLSHCFADLKKFSDPLHGSIWVVFGSQVELHRIMRVWLAVAQQCQTLMDQRAAARQRSGKDTASLCISPTEPEAALQKQKNGRGFAPTYTPSVWANTARIIVAHALDTT